MKLTNQEIKLLMECLNNAPIKGAYAEIVVSTKQKLLAMSQEQTDTRKYDDIANEKLKNV